MIHNQFAQPIALQSTDGLLCQIGETNIAKFSTSNIIFRDLYVDECHAMSQI